MPIPQSWKLVHKTIESPDNSDTTDLAKEVIVFGGKGNEWKIYYAQVKVVSGSTGAPIIQMQVRDSGATLTYQRRVGRSMGASDGGKYYMFAPGVPTDTAFDAQDTTLANVQIPDELVIPNGGDLRFFDIAGKAASDSVTVEITYGVRSTL